ncbi:MAG: hypothetical protein QOE41_4985 [Mycobacterium sp.]|nr:hypothetical protein [Mycobacterium sp.]MDT5135674.1 hypothetical protein [Mycobacterium sp.]
MADHDRAVPTRRRWSRGELLLGAGAAAMAAGAFAGNLAVPDKIADHYGGRRHGARAGHGLGPQRRRGRG